MLEEVRPAEFAGCERFAEMRLQYITGFHVLGHIEYPKVGLQLVAGMADVLAVVVVNE
jgi:hypothetical protein